MSKLVTKLVLAVALVAPVAAHSADLVPGSEPAYCAQVAPSALMGIPDDESLVNEVLIYMEEAITVANTERWIESARPVFTWASETKIACGKAYGYLRTGYRDMQYLDKCECFYGRMRHYMN